MLALCKSGGKLLTTTHNTTHTMTELKKDNANEIRIIKEAISQGNKVFMTTNKAYEVIKDDIGQYLIICHINNHCVGLHGRTNYINFLCQDDGEPYPATIIDKNGNTTILPISENDRWK